MTTSNQTMKWVDLLPYVQQEATAQGSSVAAVLMQQGVSDLNTPLAIQWNADPEVAKLMLAKELVTASKTGGASRTTTSGKKIPEEQLGAVASAASDAGGIRAELQPLLSAMLGTASRTADQQLAGIQQGAAASAKARIVDAQVEAAQQQQTSRLLDGFAINSTGQNRILAENTAIIARAEETMRTLAPAIQEAQSANPLTNVLGWLGGQVKLMELVPKYNAAARVSNQASKAIATSQQLAAQQKALEPAITVDQIHARARLAQEVDLARAQVEAAKAKNELLTHQINVLQVKEGFANKDVQQSVLLAQLMTEHESRLKKEGMEEEEARKVAGINALYAMIGKQPISAYEWQQKDRKERDFLIDNLPVNGRFRTFGDGVAVIAAAGSKNSLAASGRLVEVTWIEEAEKAAAARYGSKYALEKNMTPQDVQIRAMNDLAADWKKDAAKREYDKLSDGNPYKLNVGLAARNPLLENNSIAQYIVGQSKEGRTVNLKEALAYGFGKIKSNPQASEQVMQDMHNFITKGYEGQFESLGAIKYGFDPANPDSKKVEYPVSSGMFEWGITNKWSSFANGKQQPVNLLNYAELKNFMVRNTAESIKNSTVPQLGPDDQKSRDAILQDMELRKMLNMQQNTVQNPLIQ